VLYTFYSPFCHQFAFRSLFLFGEQAAYPRSISRTDLIPFEEAVRGSAEFDRAVEEAMRFFGLTDPQIAADFDPICLQPADADVGAVLPRRSADGL
jgi:hypothetical protein